MLPTTYQWNQKQLLTKRWYFVRGKLSRLINECKSIAIQPGLLRLLKGEQGLQQQPPFQYTILYFFSSNRTWPLRMPNHQKTRILGDELVVGFQCWIWLKIVPLKCHEEKPFSLRLALCCGQKSRWNRSVHPRCFSGFVGDSKSAPIIIRDSFNLTTKSLDPYTNQSTMEFPSFWRLLHLAPANNKSWHNTPPPKNTLRSSPAARLPAWNPWA